MFKNVLCKFSADLAILIKCVSIELLKLVHIINFLEKNHYFIYQFQIISELEILKSFFFVRNLDISIALFGGLGIAMR